MRWGRQPMPPQVIKTFGPGAEIPICAAVDRDSIRTIFFRLNSLEPDFETNR